MRTSGLLRVILILMFAFVSCKSNKDLIYLQNLPIEEIYSEIPFSSSEYLLKKGDNLFIQVKSINPDVNELFNPTLGIGTIGGTTQQYGSLSAQYINGYQVSGSGNVELPVIGEVFVQGKTLNEAKQLLRGRVNEYFKQASVSVKLLSFKYTVMGEVMQPGVYYNYNNTCTVLEAISQAKGTTDYAKLKRVKVIRQTPPGTKSIEIDLSDKSLLTSEGYYLRPGDVVYVSPDKHKNTRLNSSLYSLALSSVSTLIVILKYLGD